MIRIILRRLAPFFGKVGQEEQGARHYWAVPRRRPRNKNRAQPKPVENAKNEKEKPENASGSESTGLFAGTRRVFFVARETVERHSKMITAAGLVGAGLTTAYTNLNKEYESDAKVLHELENRFDDIREAWQFRKLLSGPVVRKSLFELEKSAVEGIAREAEKLDLLLRRLDELDKKMHSNFNCLHTYTVSWLMGLRSRLNNLKSAVLFDIHCLEIIVNHRNGNLVDAKNSAHEALNIALELKDGFFRKEKGASHMKLTACNLLGLVYRSLVEEAGESEAIKTEYFEFAKKYFQEAGVYSQEASSHDQAVVYHNLGFLCTSAYADKASIEEALSYHKEAHNLAPNDASISAGYAFCLHQQGDGSEAFNVYDSSLTLNFDPIVFSNMAWLLLDLNRTQKSARLAGLAAEVLDEVLEAKPNHRNAIYYKGLVEAQMGNRDEAIKKLREARANLAEHDSRRTSISEDMDRLKKEKGPVYLEPRMERYSMSPLETMPTKEDIEEFAERFRKHREKQRASRQQTRRI